MPILVIVAAAAVAVSIPLLWWSFASSQTSAGRAAADNLLSGTTNLRDVMLTRSARERAVQPLMRSIGERIQRLTPVGMLETLDRRIALVGRPAAWPLDRVLAVKFILAGAAMVVGALHFFGDPSLGRLVLWLGGSALAFFIPDLQLRAKGAERQKAMQNALPDVLDQMTICVEAGLGFEAAMAKAGTSGEGPLADELVRTLQEMQVGVGRGEALRNLAARNDAKDLRHFTTAMLQAESYGIPVADVLRAQAAELRVKRRQRAEEHAMKIPVKIVFPLVFCILPALFIIILGPAAISISQNLLGS